MSKMRFAVRLPGGPLRPDNRRLMKQLGCTDVIVQQPEPGANLLLEKIEIENDGLRCEVIDGSPRADKILWNRPGRDEQLEEFCTTLEHWGEAGIKVITVHQWRPKRSGEHSMTGLREAAQPQVGSTMMTSRICLRSARTVTLPRRRPGKTWLTSSKRRSPAAEKAGVLMTFHPDDPPIPSNQGVPRILHSVEAFDRLLEIAPSDNLGLNFCVGCLLRWVQMSRRQYATSGRRSSPPIFEM